MLSQRLSEIENSFHTPKKEKINFLVNVLEPVIKEKIIDYFKTTFSSNIVLTISELAKILGREKHNPNYLELNAEEYTINEIYLAIERIFNNDPEIIVTLNKSLFPSIIDTECKIEIQWRGFLIYSIRKYLKKRSLEAGELKIDENYV